MPYDSEHQRPLADQLGYWIVRLAQDVKAAHGRHLHDYDMTPTQYWILKVIRQRADATPSLLAAVLGIDRAQSTRVVQALARRGLVRRSRDGNDQRVVHLELTGKARELLTRLDGAVGRAERELAEGLPEARREELRELLKDRVGSRGGWGPADL